MNEIQFLPSETFEFLNQYSDSKSEISILHMEKCIIKYGINDRRLYRVVWGDYHRHLVPSKDHLPERHVPNVIC